VLPFFQGCRAAVRAKTSLASAALEGDPARRLEHESRAREYLNLAGRWGATPPPSRLVAIGGYSGTGKSTVAARLAPLIGAMPGAAVLRSDVLRKVLRHHDPEERLGPDAYAPEVTRALYHAIGVRAADLLRAGACVIADATFLSLENRDAIAEVAAQCGASFTGIWLDAPEALLAERLRLRKADASDATADVLAEQIEHDTGAVSWQRVDASRGVDAVVTAARAVLGVPGVEPDAPDPAT
jgi:predicted kinase